jgi:aspartyl-tRNA(Asn)/glutamyl-tRNA(Gln) amidotransferase subunit A
LSRTPGGSSSGSAAAVACGMCLAALGTQTGGSTIRPASYCGVYALKPSHGAISTRGILPLAPSLDHIGIMANSVRDLTIIYEAVADRPGEPAAAPADLSDDFDWFIAGTLEATDPSLRSFLASRLSEVVPDVLPRQFVPPVEYTDVRRHHLTVMAVEAAQVHADRLGRHVEDYPPEIAGLIRTGMATPGPALVEARSVRTRLCRRLRQRLGRDKLLIGSATVDTAPDRSTTGSPALNSPWSLLGLPVVSVVAGQSSSGLPASFQLIGGPATEAGVLTAARWLESKLGRTHRLPPVPG